MANVTSKNSNLFNFKPDNTSQYTLLDKLEHRNNNFLAKSKIEEFNIKFLNGLSTIIKEYPENSINFDDYLNIVVNFSDNVDKKLIINRQEDLDKLLASIEMSNILLNQSIRNKDLETMETSFSTLESNLKIINVLK